MAQEDFLNRTPFAQALKTINKWDLIKLKNFCTAKDTHLNKAIERENIFTKYIFNKDLVSKMYKEFLKTEYQKNK